MSLLCRVTLAFAASLIADPLAAQMYLGTRPWIVYKGYLGGDKPDEPVADFDDEKQAKNDAEARNAKLPLSSPFSYWARERKQLDPAAPATDQSPPGDSPLVGRTARGKFAGIDMRMKFASGTDVAFSDPKTGKLVAKGKWRSDGRTVTLQTPTYKYEGSFVGDMLTGTRKNTAKPDRPKQQWFAKLERDEPKPAGESYVGTWINESEFLGIRVRKVMTVQEGGTLTSEEYQDGQRVNRHSHQWKMDGDRIMVTNLNGEWGDWTDFFKESKRSR